MAGLKKIYKVVEKDNGTITIYGSGRDIKTFMKKPEWSEEEETAFRYRGQIYFLSEFMNIHNKVHNPNVIDWMSEFNGYHNDTYFSGVLVKLSDDGEIVKAYTYIS